MLPCGIDFYWRFEHKRRSNQSILKAIGPEYSLEGLTLKLQYFGHLMRRTDSLEKILMLGKIEGRRRRAWQRMSWLGWHHQLNEHEFEQASGVGDGQGSLACCSPWGCKDLDTTEQLNWTDMFVSDSFPLRVIRATYLFNRKRKVIQSNTVEF